VTRPAVRPVSPSVLAGLVADRSGAAAGLRRPDGLRPGGLRMGIDGPVADDAHALADAVAAELVRRAVPVARVCADDFLRARSLRWERGADNPEAFGEGWYDLGTLRREVLDPMEPGRAVRTWLPRLRDPVTDRPYREPRREAPASMVVVLDGRFLARWEIADAVDVRVHLDVSPAARARRVPGPEQARVLPAWADYLQWYQPAASATLVVRYDRPGHPAIRPG
jgi:hypothetical protein